MDIEPYLAPVSDEEPAGPDIYDWPERDAIQSLIERDDADVPASEWPPAIKKLRELARQTRDMWVAVRLTEAGARAGDLETVDDGARLLAGLLERDWDELHPKLSDYDFEARANMPASLTRIREFLGPLKRTTLFATRVGSFSAADLERFSLEGDAADGYGMFRVALDQLRQQGQLESTAQGLVDRVDSIRDAIRRADAVLTANSGSDTATNFQPTYEAIDSIRRLILPYAGVAAEPEAETGPADMGSGALMSGGGGRIGGRVDSREDVIKALDAIADYYRQREPASPVPVLLKRARHWVNMDFLAVLQDLVPGSVDEAKTILVSKLEEQDEYGNSAY
jgi:type VI secretion system protein ImpA